MTISKNYGTAVQKRFLFRPAVFSAFGTETSCGIGAAAWSIRDGLCGLLREQGNEREKNDSSSLPSAEK